MTTYASTIEFDDILREKSRLESPPTFVTVGHLHNGEPRAFTSSIKLKCVDIAKQYEQLHFRNVRVYELNSEGTYSLLTDNVKVDFAPKPREPREKVAKPVVDKSAVKLARLEVDQFAETLREFAKGMSFGQEDRQVLINEFTDMIERIGGNTDEIIEVLESR